MTYRQVVVGPKKLMAGWFRINYFEVLGVRPIIGRTFSSEGNGVYGVISYTTARRTHEIGVRMAIGGDRGNVIRMVLRETIVLIAAGLAVGVPAALAAARLVAATLAGVSPHDPGTLVSVSLMLLIVGLLAGFFPAARASRLDPMAALRQE